MSTHENASLHGEIEMVQKPSVLTVVTTVVPLREAVYGCHTVTVNYLGKEEGVGLRNVWQLKDLV